MARIRSDYIKVPKNCAYAFEELLFREVAHINDEYVNWIGRSANETGLAKLYRGKEDNILVKVRDFEKARETRSHVFFKLLTNKI